MFYVSGMFCILKSKAAREVEFFGLQFSFLLIVFVDLTAFIPSFFPLLLLWIVSFLLHTSPQLLSSSWSIVFPHSSPLNPFSSGLILQKSPTFMLKRLVTHKNIKSHINQDGIPVAQTWLSRSFAWIYVSLEESRGKICPESFWLHVVLIRFESYLDSSLIYIKPNVD